MSPIHVPHPLSRRRRETRRRLFAAARTLFAEQGVNGTTVEEISEVAGFTRGAFYSNFADKEDILIQLCAAEYERVLAELDHAWAEVVIEQHDLHDVADIVAQLLNALPIDRDFYLVQTELALHLVRHPELAESLGAPAHSFTTRITEQITTGLNAIGRDTVIPSSVMAEVILGVAVRAMQYSFSGMTRSFGDDPEHFLREVLPHLLTGLTQPKKPS